MIYTKNLRKEYGDKTVLSDINIDISSGAIVGLLGKNGAGKTTFNKILTGLSFPTEGEVLVCGSTPKCGSQKVGFLSENISIFPTLSAYDNLAQIFLINNMKPDKKRITDILETISIENTKKTANKFSLGMKRRLQIAMSTLVSDRDVLILDEPTNGLDINGVIWLQELLEKLKQKNKTIIMTSHAIKQLEGVLTSYFILNQGTIVASGDMDSIKSVNISIKLQRDDFHKASNSLQNIGVSFFLEENNSKIIIKDATEEISNTCIKVLMMNSVIPISFETNKKSLVDIFVSSTKVGEKND